MIIQDSRTGELWTEKSILAAGAKVIGLLDAVAKGGLRPRCWSVVEPSRDGNTVVEWWLGVPANGRECQAVVMVCGAERDVANLQTVVGARTWEYAADYFQRLVEEAGEDFADSDGIKTGSLSAERET